MRISVITPTCDRPAGIALLETYMSRQTVQPDEWIVGDGGQRKASLTLGQRHLWSPREPGQGNFASNLLAAVHAASGDAVVIFEDDDWYAPTHVETILGQLRHPGILAAGDDLQRYYNVAKRVWRIFHNRGASLCQTAFRRELVPTFVEIVQRLNGHSYGVDGKFWEAIPADAKSLEQHHTVVGIKGLTGQSGLGIGHRPSGGWTADPDLSTLRQWIGPDADAYSRFGC